MNDNLCVVCAQISYGYKCYRCQRKMCKGCVAKIVLVGSKGECVCVDCIKAEDMLEKIRPNA